MKGLENYGVQELNAMEILGIEGGFIGSIAKKILEYVAVYVITEIAANPSAHLNAARQGFADGLK